MMKRSVVVCLFVLAAFVAADPPPQGERAVEAKRKHLATVLEELSTRDVSHLSPDRRARRAAVLTQLRAYAARGVFPRNTKLPQYELPYLIDDDGTRCALASAIDEAGAGALLARLARTDNHGYVAHLQHDRELVDWLAHHGLTIDEAAFIQAPGIIDDPSDGNDDWEIPVPTTETPAPDPGHETPPSETPPPTPAPSTPTTRTPRGGADTGAWSQWWRYNRDAFWNLRERYHAAAVTTGQDRRARRPDAALRKSKLVPFLARIAQEEDDVKATALMAWALAAEEGAGAPAVAGTLEYLRNPESRYRDLMLLALGLARDAGGVAALRGVLHDTKAGRRLLARRAPIPERTRAFAAVALGQCGDASAVDDLMQALDGRGDLEDLRAAAITSLGDLAQGRTDVVQRLETELKRARWTEPVLAAIPAALVKLGATDAVLRNVQRFRGSRRVRESCALALGFAQLDEPVADALVAAARRDPDLQTRRHAAIALGELAFAAPKDTPAALVRKLKRFYTGTLDGHFKQPGAMEWHLLSSGLFARRFGDTDVIARLTRVAKNGRKRDERAAAVLALGVSGSRTALEPVGKVFRDAKDVRLRGCAAEALGMLQDRGAREELLRAALEDPSGAVRYQAALGLGYLADGSMTAPLVDALGTSRSAPARAALTRVLGQIGDRRAIDGLVEIAGDTSRPRTTRERAVGALGLLGREADRGWTFTIRRGFNFNRATPVMRRVLGIF